MVIGTLTPIKYNCDESVEMKKKCFVQVKWNLKHDFIIQKAGFRIQNFRKTFDVWTHSCCFNLKQHFFS